MHLFGLIWGVGWSFGSVFILALIGFGLVLFLAEPVRMIIVGLAGLLMFISGALVTIFFCEEVHKNEYIGSFLGALTIVFLFFYYMPSVSEFAIKAQQFCSSLF